MSITPKAIQDLLDELEASRQARRRAWDVLQDLRAVLTNLGNVTIEVPSRKTFEAEGAILKQALSDCLRDQRGALALLADAARQVDKAAFGIDGRFRTGAPGASQGARPSGGFVTRLSHVRPIPQNDQRRRTGTDL